MGEVFGGRYELVDLLGVGGAGSVWRVWDWKSYHYSCAKLMKQSDSTSLLRFIRETGTKVDHPHVVAPSSWAGADDQVLFTMDLIKGGSISTLLKDYGRLPDWFALVVTDQLLDALATVHGQGLIHRDIKPANLLLEPTGADLPRVRLADFGIAARVDDARLTHLTQVVGTPGYMSPSARHGADPSPSQDLYATAMVLLEMLTGTRPQEDQPLPGLDGVPCHPRLAPFIGRLITEGPGGFASAAEARNALRQLSAVTTPQSDPIEVFDQIGELPEGWGEQGPTGRPPAFPASGASAPSAPTHDLQRSTPPYQSPFERSDDAKTGLANRSRPPKSVALLGVIGSVLIIMALIVAIF